MEDTDLNRIQTTESVFLPISREAFEKLYLTPKNPHVTGDLRKKVGNPTPISLLGFLIASTSNACIMMGWRGSGGQGAAIVYVFLSVVTYGDLVLGITMWLIEYSPVFIFFGGMVQIFGGVGEWIIGNTFTCALFFTYGTFFIVHGALLMPFFATGIHFSPTGDFLEGQENPMFLSSLGLYYVSLTVLTFVYLVCSIRTNFCLFSALMFLVLTFGLFAASYFSLSAGEAHLAATLQMAGGAFNFILCIPVWWIFITQILEAVDFPISLPVGDFSTLVPGRSQLVRDSV